MRSIVKDVINAGPPPAGPYSTAVRAGGFLYVSGTVAQDRDGGVVGRGDVRVQVRHVLERMRGVLETAGSSLADVVSATVYLTDASHFQPMNEAYRAFWSQDPPTRTTVITGLVLPDALVEISMIAVPRGGERAVVQPAGWMRSPNPYSYAIRSGDTVFLSGLVPRRGRDNSNVAGDITVQTEAVLTNAAELLDAAGMSLANVVSSRVYLTSVSDFASMNGVYRRHFPQAPPARATVATGLAGPGFLVEMTFVAASSPRQAIGAPPEGFPISPAVRAGQRLYLSGALGNTPETAGDVGAQTRETLTNLQTTLKDAGASSADVVESLVYLTDAASFAAMNDAYRVFFGGNFPARTTVVTPLMDEDGLVEIMLTAVLP